MGSILHGFEYDIFISYRHNDNRSGWVTEFVKALQEELAATIKEPVSVYFDSNPHDGLLETHNVDKSLEGKLKCLIFIPILSQTYCDPKSFAWQHEFCSFNKLAKEDQFGIDIKLSHGNVASRILPIKIHDLDEEDKSLLEKEFGAILRAIEFIYKEPGVNRPLKPSDDKIANQNKTNYRNQINKVANAIKELIKAIKNPNEVHTLVWSEEKKDETIPWLQRRNNRIWTTFVALLIALVYFLISNSSFFQLSREKSIAVLPFVNMSNDPDQEFFSVGLSVELLTMLGKIPGLKVIGQTSSFSFKGKNLDARSIAQKLDVGHILEGTVRKSGNTLRITAQLISAIDGSEIWSETYDRTPDDIFRVQDEITLAVVSQLKVALLLRDKRSTTQNREAYNLYLEGKYFADRSGKENYVMAISKYKQSLALDSTTASVWASMAVAFLDQMSNGYVTVREGIIPARASVQRALQIDPLLFEGCLILTRIYGDYEWNWAKADSLNRKASELAPANAEALSNASRLAKYFGHFEEAVALDKKAIELDPLRASYYLALSLDLYYANNLTESEVVIRKLLEFNPTYVKAYNQLANIQLAEGKYEAALESIQKESDNGWRLVGLPLVYFKLDRKNESDAKLKELIELYGNVGAYQIAEVYAFRGETDLAFQWLDRAYQQLDPGLAQSKGDPLLKNLWNDIRWLPFLKKMGLVN